MQQLKQIQGSSLGTAQAATGVAQHVRRILTVESATGFMDVAVTDLQEAIDELEFQLEPLLCSVLSGESGLDRAQGASVVSERILGNADRISQQSSRIRELTKRL